MTIPLIEWLNILTQEEKRKRAKEEARPFAQLPLPSPIEVPNIEEKPKKESDTTIIIDM